MARAMVAMLALVGCAAGQVAPAAGPVRPGIEVLLADSAHLVRGRRVGLVTNHTGVDGAGTSDVDRLLGAGVALAALFSPEHGFRGAAAPGEHVTSSTDSATGLPIYSLYGAARAPKPEMLQGLDVLLVDLQDVGARYFTYLSTTIEVMRAAGASGIPVVVLDRPNPLGGAVQGNVLDPAFRTFVGPLAMPMRPGLTLGELARLAVRELELRVALTVVPASGWRRSMRFDATGLPFVPPSPNLPRLEGLLHYPGLCLFEGTNLSVGRGTAMPFEVIAAPWLDAAGIRDAMGEVDGVKLMLANGLTPRAPGDSKYADTVLTGLRLQVVDPARYDPTEVAVRLLAAVRARHPAEFRWIPAHFDRLAGTDALRKGLDAGRSAASFRAAWARQRDAWMPAGKAVQIYPD
ncbi:MAG TPA: DUF1343 domain-containing protein [Gemmatimonadales bacterium]|nr:DUF1343 domain-containing protein [Gemmatimonadales bacterium]